MTMMLVTMTITMTVVIMVKLAAERSVKTVMKMWSQNVCFADVVPIRYYLSNAPLMLNFWNAIDDNLFNELQQLTVKLSVPRNKY